MTLCTPWTRQLGRLTTLLMALLLIVACQNPATTEIDATEVTLESADEHIAHYTCPMHPSIITKDPTATCPICSMDLVAVMESDKPAGTISLSQDRQDRYGVKTSVATHRALTIPVHAVGSAVYEETDAHIISVHVDGWITSLPVARVGATVSKGATLARWYSPKIDAALTEILANPESASGARVRLRRWGLGKFDTDRLLAQGSPDKSIPITAPMSGVVSAVSVRNGSTLSAGSALFTIIPAATALVDLTVFGDDVPPIGSLVTIASPAMTGTVTSVDASVSVDGSRVVRVTTDESIDSGARIMATISVDHGEHLVVPTSSVVYGGGRTVVYVLGDGDWITPVIVTTGPQSSDYVAILTGLNVGDEVVSAGTFLIAAESRLRTVTTDVEADHAHH